MSLSLPPNKDCRHRQDRRCGKTGKTIALDMRDPDNIKCWNCYGCNHYEAVEEKT